MFGFIADMAKDFINQTWADERQEDGQQFATGEAAAQRAWQERMRSTQYQTTVDDLKAAGLNPMLAYHNGGAGVPSGGVASAGLASPGHSASSAAALQTRSVIELNEAAADEKRASAENLRATAPTHEVTREHLKQQIGESAVRIEKIFAETTHSQASARNVEQQTVNLKEAVAQIRATVQNLQAHTKQHTASTGLTEAQTKETNQRIQAQLPQIEQILKNLEAMQRRLAMPGHEAQAAAQDSLAGQLGAYLRAINPLKGWLDSSK